MPFIKDPYALFVEAASSDLEANTEGAIMESTIRKRLNSIEEVAEDLVITAEMVTVIHTGNDFLVEMNNLAPYMKTNEIKSVAEALDNIAWVNNLPPKSVGLLTESDGYIQAMLEKAGKSKASKNKILEKISKATDISEKLKKDGYKVKKKKTKKAKKKKQTRLEREEGL